jgi:ammonia channel protein AmtB
MQERPDPKGDAGKARIMNWKSTTSKVIIFRIVNSFFTLVAGRIIFGSWFVAPFQLFLIVYCMCIHWVFETVWVKWIDPKAQEVVE